MKTRITLLILITSFLVILTGCWNSRELNTLSIGICTGIDKTEKGYRVIVQILNPKSIVRKESTYESPIVVYSEEAEDLLSALRKITTQNPRKVYFSHLRMVVIGEDAARDGIEKIVDLFTRDSELRTDFYFVVAKNTTANELLNVITPLETVPGIEIYNSLRASEKSWAPTKSVKIIELINSLISEGKNPVLTGVEIPINNNDITSIDVLAKSDGSNKLTLKGLGAFKYDKLVGWLNEDESKGYNYITGMVRSTIEHLEEVNLSCEIKDTKSKITAHLIDNKLVINVDISVLQNVAEVNSKFDVTTEESKKRINELSEKEITNFCNQVIRKAQKELETDIFGFGEVVHKKYPKLWLQIKENWNNEFSHLTVNVNVNVKTKQLGLLTKPYFFKGDE